MKLSITTLSITTLSIITFSMLTLSIMTFSIVGHFHLSLFIGYTGVSCIGLHTSRLLTYLQIRI
jgi:hypothetical protein